MKTMEYSEPNNPDAESEATLRPPDKLNFFQKFFSFFLKGDNPDEERKRLLKEIGRSLHRSNQKFYNPKKELALPALGSFMYEYYKLFSSARNLIQRSKSSAVIKELIIDSFLTSAQIQLRNNLEEDSIRDRLAKADPKTVTNQVKDEVIEFFSVFDAERVRSINRIFNMINTFMDLIHFDYYFLLKKYDSQIQEDQFYYNPKFESINGEYVLDDLKDFYDIILGLREEADWNKILDILKMYRNVELVSRKSWKKGLKKLMDLKRSRVLDMIIQHISKDPFYKAKPLVHNEKIVDQYLSKLKSQTELTMHKIFQEQKNVSINELTKIVFGTASVSRLKNYTEKANLTYRKKMLGGFIYVTALNYLKAFFLDYFKRDIREVVDLLLIKGEWTTNVTSQQLSESFHQLMVISDRLLVFDESLAEEGEIGRKLKSAFVKAERDKQAIPPIRKMLKEVNDMAKQLIIESGQNMIVIGKYLKLLVDDYTNKRSNVLVNWKVIDNKTDNRVRDILVEVYKKIYYFLKLLQHYNK